MRKITVENNTERIPIGRIGENEATEVIFNVAGWEEQFGESGTFTLLHQRNGDPGAYPCVTEYEDGKIRWTVHSGDLTREGNGRCELCYLVDGVVAKSVIYTTVTGAALTGGAEPPEPWEDWVTRILSAGQIVEDFLETLQGGNENDVWTKTGQTAAWKPPQGGGGGGHLEYPERKAV